MPQFSRWGVKCSPSLCRSLGPPETLLIALRNHVRHKLGLAEESMRGHMSPYRLTILIVVTNSHGRSRCTSHTVHSEGGRVHAIISYLALWVGSEAMEAERLKEDANRLKNWKRWGPYLSERQWGTVREDYSETGDWYRSCQCGNVWIIRFYLLSLTYQYPVSVFSGLVVRSIWFLVTGHYWLAAIASLPPGQPLQTFRISVP